MKHVAPSPEVSLAMVRELSENAVCRPWQRQLRCLSWSLRDRHRLVPVYQPWLTNGVDTCWEGRLSRADLVAVDGTQPQGRY